MPMEVVLLKKVEKAIRCIINSSVFIGAIVTALMMFLTVVDVVGRRFFHSPVPGTFELTRISLVVVVFAGLGLAQAEGENIGIGILYDRFPKVLRNIIDLLTAMISIVLFSIIFLHTINYAKRIAAANQVTSVLRLPVHPWIILSAIGVGVLILALIWDLIVSVLNFKGGMTDES